MKHSQEEHDSAHGDISRPLISWRLEQLEAGQKTMMVKLEEITVTIAQSKGAVSGGRIVLASVSSLIGAAFALITFWFTWKRP